MSDTFYRAFEDRYRGSRDIIKARLAAYLPFIAPLTSSGRPAGALDLGCGRGEWLELLTENHFDARGVDLDEHMLEACRERALPVERTDALSSLRALPDNSLALVSAFHLVEHMPFDQVQQLVGEALRVLQPGGLLIMETPNSENLVVGASSFYLDPSHLRPVPPALLAFVTEHCGFLRHKVVRLQEDRQLHTDAPIGLINVFDGVSPDYAVVAQKAAPQEILAGFDAPFEASYGFALADLAVRYEQQEDRQRNQFHAGLRQLEVHVIENKSALAHLTQRTDKRLRAFEENLRQSEARAAQYEQQILALHASTSWRITAPLRWASRRAQHLRAAARERRIWAAVTRRLRRAVALLVRPVLRQPRLKQVLNYFLRYFPGLRSRLRTLMQSGGMPELSASSEADMSPRTARMVDELKKSLEAKKH